jgi:hypothetical protein
MLTLTGVSFLHHTTSNCISPAFKPDKIKSEASVLVAVSDHDFFGFAKIEIKTFFPFEPVSLLVSEQRLRL